MNLTSPLEISLKERLERFNFFDVFLWQKNDDDGDGKRLSVAILAVNLRQLQCLCFL